MKLDAGETQSKKKKEEEGGGKERKKPRREEKRPRGAIPQNITNATRNHIRMRIPHIFPIRGVSAYTV